MLVSPYYLRYRPVMLRDPLSEILTFLDARCLLTGGFKAGGQWGVRFPRPDALKFAAITHGTCWLVMDDLAAPMQLGTGDVIFFKGDRPFDLLSEPGLEADDADLLFADDPSNMIVIGTGADFENLGGHVAFDHKRGSLLLDSLPPLIHVPAASTESTGLQWLVRELVAEGLSERAGGVLSTSHIAQLIFVRVLRAHLSDSEMTQVGWLRGLGDEKIAMSLRLIHADPGRDWSLKDLARESGMSRSVFAARFKEKVGVAPLSYLTAWRMNLATQALQDGAQSIATIAESLGYTSESAFSNAFKRMFGAAPKRFQSASKSQHRS